MPSNGRLGSPGEQRQPESDRPARFACHTSLAASDDSARPRTADAFLDDLGDLIDEPGVDAARRRHVVGGVPDEQGAFHQMQPSLSRHGEGLEHLIPRSRRRPVRRLAAEIEAVFSCRATPSRALP